MKKTKLKTLELLLIAAIALSLTGCRRYYYKLFHRQLPPTNYVRIAEDSTAHNDIGSDGANWDDEPLIDIPDIPGETDPYGNDNAGVDELENYMGSGL